VQIAAQTLHSCSSVAASAVMLAPSYVSSAAVLAAAPLLSGLRHYGVRYGVRLYGTVRKYGVQPYLYGFRIR